MSRLQLLAAAAANPAPGGGEPPPDPPATDSKSAAYPTGINGTHTTSTITTTSTWRTRHTTLRNVTALALGYGNQYLSADADNPFTIAVSIEKLDGTLIPVTWDGSPSATCAVGGHIISDAMPVSLAAGAQFYLRAKITVPLTSSTRPHGAYTTLAARGEGTNYYGGGGDKLTGTWTDFTDAVPPTIPVAIIGTGALDPDHPVVALIGDSIMEPTDAWAVQHALANSIDFLQLGVGAQAMSHLADSAVRARWWGDGVLGAADVALLGMGRNDLTGAAGMSTLQANAIAVWNALRADGVDDLWQTTTTPLTTSSDGWATVGNQTAGDSGEPHRLSWNAWLRDGAPISGGAPVATGGSGTRAGEVGHPLTGIVDVALAAESSLNSGKWVAGWTSDGLHPNATGKAGIAAAVPAYV